MSNIIFENKGIGKLIKDHQLAVPDAVNLEHILPQNPHGNWSSFSDEQLVSLKNRLGNLTLLQSKINSEEGNAPFNSKKERFNQSELWITKMISETYESWTEESIINRQQKLAEIAVQTWSIKIDSK